MSETLLKPLRTSEIFWRGLYGIDHGGHSYVVEVDYFDFKERVRLYRDGLLADERKSPARFPLDDGSSIEAAMALYGMKRACFFEEGGRKQKLRPLRGTAEERRLSFDRTHPLASRSIAAVAWSMLVIALVTQIPNTINGLAKALSFLPLASPISPIPTFSFPDWLNVTLSVGGIAAGLDRGLRMVHNPVIDD